MSEAYNTARFMHGSVKEYDDNYMETYIPQEILNKMHDTPSFVDTDGFTWGFSQVFAKCHEGVPYICLASKYMGQGYSEIKYIVPPSNEVRQMHTWDDLKDTIVQL